MLVTKSYTIGCGRRSVSGHDTMLILWRHTWIGRGRPRRRPPRRFHAPARGMDAADAVALHEQPGHRGVLDDARPRGAGGAREALRGLHGVAVAGGGLVAAGHPIVGAQPRLDPPPLGR